MLGFTAVRWLSLVAVSGGYSLVVMRGLLIVVASLVWGHGLYVGHRCVGFSSYGTWAQ